MTQQDKRMNHNDDDEIRREEIHRLNVELANLDYVAVEYQSDEAVRQMDKVRNRIKELKKEVVVQ